MVMALQHQIDLALVEHRLPRGLHLGRVLRSGAGEDGLVEQHDIPFRLAGREGCVKPCGLLRHGAKVDRRRAVQHDEAHPLIIDKIGGPEARHAIVGQRELQREIGAERAAFAAVGLHHIDIFMIAGRGQLRDDRPVIAAGLVELAPFVVMVQIVALRGEVAGMGDQLDPAIGVESLADDAAGIGQDAVLDVAQIEEAERPGLCRRGTELQPLAPARTALQPIGIDGIGRQIVEADLVIEGRAIGAVLGRAGGTGHGPGLLLQRRAVDGDGDLRFAGGLGGIGAPGNGHAARRIGGGRQHDPIGQGARRIGCAGRAGHGRAGGRLGGERRGARHQQHGQEQSGHGRPFRENGTCRPRKGATGKQGTSNGIRSWRKYRTSRSSYIPHIAAGACCPRNSDRRNIWRC